MSKIRGVEKAPRFLLLEDDNLDAELLRRALAAEWPQSEILVVYGEKDFATGLSRTAAKFDLILSDYVLPGFSGMDALAFARQHCPGIPFIFVSGAIGDDVAVESLKAGATDYLLKDRLSKLVPAVRRALNEAKERHSRWLTEEQLKLTEELYRGLINSVDGIVWQADLPSLRFTFVSQQAERLLGYPVNWWLEEPDFWQNHIHPDDRERAAALCRQLTTEQKYHSFEYRMLNSKGEVIWFRDIVSIRVEENQPTQIQGIMVNITPRKQAEAARRDVQAKLEKTNKALRQKNQEIQNFYHTLSHELKTPLTSAREFISITMDGLAGPLNEIQCEYLGTAKESCDQLRDCINDLLDATRLETGKLPLELKAVAVAPMVARVAAAMKPLATQKGLVLTHEVEADLPHAVLDEHRITQVLTNLVNNAIKHTPSCGSILVQAGLAPNHRELLKISVRDNGCGIGSEDHEHIFDRLFQVKTGDASTGQGIGLGLYLCRELVQLHGGNIWVESAPGQGSTFSFVLPITQQVLRPELLIVDDDPELLDLLRELLVAEQYNVRTARDGQEALREMHLQPPDIVVLDLAMPGLTGAATLELIRKEWGEIPVILHTAFAEGDLMKQALASSPFTLLAKPCSSQQIVETVRKVQRSGDTEVWRKNHFGLDRPTMN